MTDADQSAGVCEDAEEALPRAELLLTFVLKKNNNGPIVDAARCEFPKTIFFDGLYIVKHSYI